MVAPLGLAIYLVVFQDDIIRGWCTICVTEGDFRHPLISSKGVWEREMFLHCGTSLKGMMRDSTPGLPYSICFQSGHTGWQISFKTHKKNVSPFLTPHPFLLKTSSWYLWGLAAVARSIARARVKQSFICCPACTGFVVCWRGAFIFPFFSHVMCHVSNAELCSVCSRWRCLEC